jgi:hypothetical protein
MLASDVEKWHYLIFGFCFFFEVITQAYASEIGMIDIEMADLL